MPEDVEIVTPNLLVHLVLDQAHDLLVLLNPFAVALRKVE
jgi:hypothetical protein